MDITIKVVITRRVMKSAMTNHHAERDDYCLKDSPP